MENIENELDNKSIERDENISIEVEEKEEKVVKKRTKKERSPAQIAAFEKARLKRQENYKKRQEQKNTIDNVEDIAEHSKGEEQSLPTRKPIKTQSTRKQALKSVDDYHDFIMPSNEPPQPIINNYYYGTNQYKQSKSEKSKKKKKVEIIESSSESEDDSDEEYLPPKQIQKKATPPPSFSEAQRPKPSLNFKYV